MSSKGAQEKVTEAEAEEIADAIERGEYESRGALPRDQWPVNRGRPSLTAPGKHSPQVTVRLGSTTHQRALARARDEGKTLSALTREALEAFLG
jgi:hypothetical protein